MTTPRTPLPLSPPRPDEEIQRDLVGLSKARQFSMVGDEYAHRLAADVPSLLAERRVLLARLAAIREIRGCLGAGPMDYELFVDELDEILAGTSERIEVTR